MMTDPIADMLTRIRNANQKYKEKVDIPSSNLKQDILRILKERGFISNYKLIPDGRQGVLRVYLKYNKKQRVILGLKKVSIPGKRVYRGYDKMPRVKNGLGIAVVSTSVGLLTDSQCRQRKVGGEILCYVW